MSDSKVPFDQFQRYEVATRIVKAFDTGRQLRILEVGANYHGNLRQFLPTAEIVLLDQRPPPPDVDISGFVVGDATNLQFADASFDFVVSLDVLEHVPADLRERFLAETFRVAGVAAIHGFPYSSDGVSAAESAANAVWLEHFSQNYQWLDEHLAEGLPDLVVIAKIVKQLSTNAAIFKHGNLASWQALMGLHFAKEAFPDLAKLVRQLDITYNELAFPRDFVDHAYRAFAVLPKSTAPDLPQSIKPLNQELTSFAPLVSDLFPEIYQAVRSVTSTLKLRNDALAESQRRFAEVENKLNEKAKQHQTTLLRSRDVKHRLKVVRAQLVAAELRLEGERREVGQLRQYLGAVQRSTSWRITRPIRGMRRVLSLLLHRIRRSDASVGPQQSPAALQTGAPARMQPIIPERRVSYAKWIAGSEPAIERARTKPLELSGPTISVVMPVYAPDAGMLSEAIESVIGQSYSSWQLCIADDASPGHAVSDILRKHSAKDSRIQVAYRATNGHIAAATNTALKMASGDFVAFMDHDDLLAPGALARIAEEIGKGDDIDFIYSDEDHVDTHGVRKSPFFKPDWSPTLMMAQNYIGHIVCIRRTLIEACGGLVSGTDGSQDYDLVLRATQRSRRIAHIPEILYHWREHPGSTALSYGSKPYAHEAGRQALERHLQRVYPDLVTAVESGEWAFTYEARFPCPPSIKISIVIPTRDRVELLENCIDSILELSSWANFEILVVDNDSVENETKAYFDYIMQVESRVRVMPCPIEFNWSRLNNFAVQHCSGDVLVFLNNDTLVISPDWLQTLASVALLPDVGVVGPLLLYEDGTIQHAGVVVGMGGWADHVFKGENPHHGGTPFVSPMLRRDVLAVTGACQVIARNKFDQLGGYDESFIICGSDVELCLRARRKSWRTVYLPDVSLTHLESKSRTAYIPEEDFKRSAEAYEPFRTQQVDPYFNPRLDLARTSPSLLAEDLEPGAGGNHIQ